MSADDIERIRAQSRRDEVLLLICIFGSLALGSVAAGALAGWW